MGPIKPIRRLYYQYGRLLLSPKLDAEEIFKALLAEGLVESAIQSGGRTTHYRESEKLRHIDKQVYLLAVQLAMVNYASIHCFSPVRIADIKGDR